MTQSQPGGSIPPVMMRTACPADMGPLGQPPAYTVSDTVSRAGRSRQAPVVSAARRA